MDTNETSGNEMNLKKLLDDFRTVAQDAEALAKATADDVGERVRQARSRLVQSMESARGSFQRFEDQALSGAKATDKVIRDHPYPSIGIAFGIGLLIGVLINRK